MTERLQATTRLDPEPLDPKVTSIQPGGGICLAIEMSWGRLRRRYLKTFRPSYVRRMQALRICDPIGCPHEVIDPRDLKFHRNLSGDCWRPEDDRFAWRNRIPFARAGLGELIILTGACLLLAGALGVVFWPLAIVPLALAALIVWFFRDPPRPVPSAPGLVVAPADGKVVAIQQLDHDPYIEGPAVMVGIFLSVLNVHINRSPVAARVIGLTYFPGKFLNALRARSARENEQMAVRLEENEPPYRRYIVRQIAGAIARRIVCSVRPGDQLSRGARFGMIKLGSRTEVVLPASDGELIIHARLGQPVKAGSSVIAQYLAERRSTEDP